MTKSVHVTTVHDRRDTRIFLKECITLSEAGYEVHLVCPASAKGTERGVIIHPLPTFRSRFVRIISAGWKTYRMCWNIHGDIYHFHDPEFMPWAWLLAVKNCTVVYDMHENVPAALLKKEYLGKVGRIIITTLFRLLEKICLNKFYIIFAESSYASSYPFRKDAVLVRNFPRLEMLASISVPKRKEFSIVYLGAIIAERGCFLILEAAEELRRRGYPVTCIFIGPDGNNNQEAFPFQVAATKGAKWYGKLPPEEAWRVVASCHLGLAPFLPMANLVDSYPTKVFEYMALGLPSIVSDFPLYRELIDNGTCGIAILPGSKVSLADAIQHYICDWPLLVRTSETCRSIAFAKYTWTTEADKLLNLYEKILKNQDS